VKRNYLVLGTQLWPWPEGSWHRINRKSGAEKSFESRCRGLRGARKEVFERNARCAFRGQRREEDRARSQRTFQARTFTVNGNKVTAEALTTWIENGDSLMPHEGLARASTDQRRRRYVRRFKRIAKEKSPESLIAQAAGAQTQIKIKLRLLQDGVLERFDGRRRTTVFA